MRPIHAVLLLLLAACSAPQPTYQKGAYRPVRAPTFHPTEDAPNPYAPPQVRPMPPQPQPKPKRLLPQTPETRRGPGIWGTEPPRGDYHELTRHLGDPIPEIALFKVPIPLPPDAKDAVDTLPIEWCAKEMARRADDAVLGARIYMLPPGERRCLVAHLLDACLQRERDGTRIDRLHAAGHGGAQRSDTDLWLRVEKMAAESGRRFRDTACSKPGLWSPAVDQLILDFASHDGRLNGKGQMEH